MRIALLLVAAVALSACTGPHRPRSAEGHAEPERLAPPPEAALEIGGFDAAGAMDRNEPVLGSERISRLSVPASEAPAARRMLRLLPDGERIVR